VSIINPKQTGILTSHAPAGLNSQQPIGAGPLPNVPIVSVRPWAKAPRNPGKGILAALFLGHMAAGLTANRCVNERAHNLQGPDLRARVNPIETPPAKPCPKRLSETCRCEPPSVAVEFDDRNFLGRCRIPRGYSRAGTAEQRRNTGQHQIGPPGTGSTADETEDFGNRNCDPHSHIHA
jgi:hypothetical protein